MGFLFMCLIREETLSQKLLEGFLFGLVGQNYITHFPIDPVNQSLTTGMGDLDQRNAFAGGRHIRT